MDPKTTGQELGDCTSNVEHNEFAAESQRKTNPRHRIGATKLLKDWYRSHIVYPYPTNYEKDSLAKATGLTLRQISNWFTNARRRIRGNSSGHLATDHETSTSNPPFNLESSRDAGWDGMTPFDRWRHSPPEQEPVPLDVIAQAIGTQVTSGLGISTDNGATMRAFGPRSLPLPSSDSGFESADLSQSGGSSGHSYSSGSVTSIHRYDRRRGRKKRYNASRRAPLNNSAKDIADRIYQCTFCTDTFKSRYDWTRHESALHLTLEKWTCLPFGPKHYDLLRGKTCCALCDEPDPSDIHIQSHDITACTAKPVNLRTFYRKDHLRQHLRLSHGVSEVLPSMDAWKSKVTHVKSRCGFCGETFTVWSDRNDHLSDHFRSGARMKDWKGCRGLEPAVALLVQNAIPPYLIGIESNNIEPFSASTGRRGGDGLGEQPSPTTFESLTACLGEFVVAARGNGTALTDDVLRTHARITLYGDDDPLNYTPADNDEWLTLFKQGYGLLPISLPQVESLEADNAMQVSPDSARALFSIPFTAERMQQAAPIEFWDSPTGCEMAVPWSWQTPECLAEFSQMCQIPQPTASQGELDTIGPSCPSMPTICPDPIQAVRSRECFNSSPPDERILLQEVGSEELPYQSVESLLNTLLATESILQETSADTYK